MQIKDTEIDYYIDFPNKRIHLLDLDKDERRTLTNSIGLTFQVRFLTELELDADIMGFEWYCYGTDGNVARYRNHAFKYIPLSSKTIYKPFAKVMDIRLNDVAFNKLY